MRWGCNIRSLTFLASVVRVAVSVSHPLANGLCHCLQRITGGRAAVLLCGAGALDPAVGEYIRERCTTADGTPMTLLDMYGTTESGNIACCGVIGSEVHTGKHTHTCTVVL